MELETDMPEAICDDEIVCFLADRYHTTPREVLRRFLEQERVVPDTGTGTFRLEENEMSMLRDMTASRINHGNR